MVDLHKNNQQESEEEKGSPNHGNQAADDENDRNLNPNNSPEKPAAFEKSESVDLTAQQEGFQNPQVSEYKENEENNEDEKEEAATGNQVYQRLNFSEVEFIKSYVLKYKTLIENFEKDFLNPENLEYYLLSQSFIDEWKEFVSYDQLLKDEPPLKSFGKAYPQYFNKDLLEEDLGDELVFRNEEDRCELKPQLQEGVHFRIVNKDIMEFLKTDFPGREILRRAYILPDGHKRVEIYYKKINMIFITNQVLKDLDTRQIFKFKENYALVFSQKSLQDLKEMMTEIAQSKFNRRSTFYSSYSSYKIDQVRLWKLDPDVSLSAAFDYVKKICNGTSGYDYRIEMNGKYLENSLDLKVGDLGLMEKEYLIIEIREENKAWNFIQEGVPNMEKCEYCSRYEKLTSYCSCKKVGYCNDDCRLKDKRFHSLRCEKTDEEELENPQITESSRLGLTGLSNLGNTCFMNSALQCISHTFLLTKYFLEDRYKPEINETNPLGSKGKLTEKYTILLKNLWLKSNAVFSPYGIKGALAKLNPMFSGYNQHDSQEFLSYLLDGLHEDLNRVKVKPYTETIESDGRPDETVARESWFNHLKRNNSVITDLMHGQYKSKITCPDCGHVSITFDPFLTLTLPLPTKERKLITFFFLFADNHTLPIKLEIWFKKRNHYISNLKEQVIEELKHKKLLTPKGFNFYFLSTSSLSKVTAGTPTNEIAKKGKMKMGNLFAIEMNPEMQQANEADVVEVPFSFQKREYQYSSYFSKRAITFIRPLYFLRSDTTNDMHLRIFRYFRFFFEELIENPEDKEEFLKLNDLEAYAKLFGKPDERPYVVLLQTNARSYLSCFFCGEYRCDNCKLSEKDDETLDDLLKKIKSKDFCFEMEVYWPNPSIYENHDISIRFHKWDENFKKPEEKKEEVIAVTEEKKDEEFEYKDKELESQKVVVEEEKTASSSSAMQGKKPYVITKSIFDGKNPEGEERGLYECFRLFSEPETLNAENAWYCSHCKGHKEANKEMKIYKAPQYLIVHLKRFKGGESILSAGKISTRINFPLELDLTELVMNHELPPDYKPKEEKKDNIEEEKSEKLEEVEIIGNDKMINEDDNKKVDGEPMIIENSPVVETKGNDNLLYRLYAISNHYGSVGFGHYTAFALHPQDNCWYSFDDSSVSKVTEDQIVTGAAYILFYERFTPGAVNEKPLNFDIKVVDTKSSTNNETTMLLEPGSSSNGNNNGSQSLNQGIEQNLINYTESGSVGNRETAPRAGDEE